MDIFLQTLKKAQKLEKMRAEGYTLSLSKMTFQAGRDVLSFLVNAEKSHLRFLKKQETKLRNKDRIRLSDLEVKSYRPGKTISRFEGSLDGLKGDIEILRSAAGLENADAGFYRREIDKTTEPKCIALLKKMISLERTHLKLIDSAIKKTMKESQIIASRDPRALLSKMRSTLRAKDK